MLVMLGLIELSARLVFHFTHAVRTGTPYFEYPFHPYLGWDNRPNFRYSGTLAGGLHRWTIQTDSSGEADTPAYSFRDPQVTVVVVGGSVMFGHGQSGNAHTVPAELERELVRRTGLRIEVHNLAVRGYTSFQEMLAVERYLSGHHADIVVSVSGFNDAAAAATEDGVEFGLLLHRRDPKIELIRSIERGELDAVPVTAHLLLQNLRRWSAAVDLLAKAGERLSPPRPAPLSWLATPAPDSAEVVRRARLVLTNYAMMDAMARQSGARFFMFLQPHAMTRRSLTAFEHQALDSLNRPTQRRIQPVLRVFYPALIAADKQFSFHDITRCLDDLPGSAYADDCHFLDAATPVVARAVCDVIEAPVVESARHQGVARAAP
jgi:hypothetical protein